jgi:hypothetical protein
VVKQQEAPMVGTIHPQLAVARTIAVACAAFAAAGVLAGCATSSPPVEFSKGGYSCVDDSLECINRRQGLLRQLVADHSRAWMKDPATPEAYASGVRLFAMKTKKKDLTCDELARGHHEAEGATASLRSAGGRLTPAQVSRGSMFAAEVSRELNNEMGRRCKRA